MSTDCFSKGEKGYIKKGILFSILSVIPFIALGFGIYNRNPEEEQSSLIGGIIILLVAAAILIFFATFFFVKYLKSFPMSSDQFMFKKRSTWQRRKVAMLIGGIVMAVISGAYFTLTLPYGVNLFISQWITVFGITCIIALVLFVASLLTAIFSNKIKAYTRLTGRYENGYLRVFVNIRDYSLNIAQEFQIEYDAAMNRGFTQFIKYDNHYATYYSSLAKDELFAQLERLDRLANNDKKVRKEMPSYYSGNSRLKINYDNKVTGTSVEKDPIYEAYNDYDEVVYENGVEVDRTHHLGARISGYRDVKVTHYETTATFTVISTNSLLKSNNDEVVTLKYTWKKYNRNS